MSCKVDASSQNGLLKAMVTVLDCFTETPFVDFEPRLRCRRMGRNLRYIWTHLPIRGRVIFATDLYIDVQAMPWCLGLEQCQSHCFWNCIQSWSFAKGLQTVPTSIPIPAHSTGFGYNPLIRIPRLPSVLCSHLSPCVSTRCFGLPKQHECEDCVMDHYQYGRIP